MIKFRQKIFSEYDAMRSLYVEIMKRLNGDRRRFPIITMNELPAILRGNNVVIERFVISTSFFNKDKYRMYLKIGARAKLPDEVRLPGKYYDNRLANAKVRISPSIQNRGNWNKWVEEVPSKSQETRDSSFSSTGSDPKGTKTDNPKNDKKRGKGRSKFGEKRGSEIESVMYGLEQRLFGNDKKGNGGNNNNNDAGAKILSAEVNPYVDIVYYVHKLLGEAIKYDKRARTLVLEFESIPDAIDALNILPFGINYNIYLLNA